MTKYQNYLSEQGINQTSMSWNMGIKYYDILAQYKMILTKGLMENEFKVCRLILKREFAHIKPKINKDEAKSIETLFFELDDLISENTSVIVIEDKIHEISEVMYILEHKYDMLEPKYEKKDHNINAFG